MKKLIAFWAVVIFVGASLLYGGSLPPSSHGTAQRYALGAMHAVAGSASSAVRFLQRHL